MRECDLSARLAEEDIRKVIRSYHFRPEDGPFLHRQAEALCRCCKPRAYYTFSDDAQAEVILTLGAGAEAWLERAGRGGELLCAYGADCLASYLLAREYESFDRLFAEQNGRWIKKYLFYGEQLPLEGLWEVFRRLPQTEVSCTEGYLLRPAKSVAFRALLSETPVCRASVCEDCSAKFCQRR